MWCVLCFSKPLLAGVTWERKASSEYEESYLSCALFLTFLQENKRLLLDLPRKKNSRSCLHPWGIKGQTNTTNIPPNLLIWIRLKGSNAAGSVKRSYTRGNITHPYLHNLAVHNSANGAGAEPRTKSFKETRFPINLNNVFCWNSQKIQRAWLLINMVLSLLDQSCFKQRRNLSSETNYTMFITTYFI